MSSQQLTELKQVEIYTDGACRGNPGSGGWGVILRYVDQEHELSGAVLQTTNNRMELQAAIEGLAALREPCRVAITTDSQYVKLGITQWIKAWKKKKWLTSSGQPVKNVDLWQKLDELATQHTVTWHWVRGHSGHVENERADALATSAIEKLRRDEHVS